jgi:CxxC motif-containing protein (DUF1111 family)
MLLGALATVAVAAAPMAVSPTSNPRAAADNTASLARRGAILFTTEFTPEQGLGPLFNRTSCVGCHAGPGAGGMGPDGLGTATRVGRLTPDGFDPLIGSGGPVARAHSVAEEGLPCDLVPGIPARANVTSVRNAPDLHGVGLIDAIPDDEIAAGAVPRGDGVRGRAHWVKTADGRERIGRFGWKADTATLRQFVANAFRNELGITSPLAPTDFMPAGRLGSRCLGEGDGVEDDGTMVDAVTAFLAALPPPAARAESPLGATLFRATGCAACHTPSLTLGQRRAWLYSDLLLHDLGPDLDDKMVQGQANGRDWRTTPLWGLGTRPRLLHDGRARTIAEAILAHGGEAAAARQRFHLLLSEERDALLTFLAGL